MRFGPAGIHHPLTGAPPRPRQPPPRRPGARGLLYVVNLSTVVFSVIVVQPVSDATRRQATRRDVVV